MLLYLCLWNTPLCPKVDLVDFSEKSYPNAQCPKPLEVFLSMLKNPEPIPEHKGLPGVQTQIELSSTSKLSFPTLQKKAVLRCFSTLLLPLRGGKPKITDFIKKVLDVCFNQCSLTSSRGKSSSECRMGEEQISSFSGSKWLLPVSNYFGFPLDQVNFLACQAFALCAALWFRRYLGPRHVGPGVRHAVAALFGASFLVFCFGCYSIHIFTLVAACYWITVRADIRNIHRYTMITAMGYLTVCQVSRVFIYHYGILSTDFSGPLMIITQKITLLAFQLHDGLSKKPEELTAEQKWLAVHRRPSALEYLSYTLNFLSVLVGPCSSYRDYAAFIEGHGMLHGARPSPHGARNGRNGYDKAHQPSPMAAVGRKLLVCFACMALFLTLTKAFPIGHNVDPAFVGRAPFLIRLLYAFFSIQAARPKFYFAWTLSDAVNNAAGYGFRCWDDNGHPRWDLVSNLNIMEIETATSFKVFIDNWNIQTGVWLKTVCYDRAPCFRTPLTFVLSALWHGVYPGYYFTFLTAIPITMAARAVRKSFRHYFLRSGGWKLGYDIMTWAATQLAICYTVMPFLLLAVEPTLTYYRSMHFHVHIISMLTVLVLHSRSPQSSGPASQPAPRPLASPSPDSLCQPGHTNNNLKLD